MNKSQRIVKQAGILALAGILVRIIGVLYRSPLTAMIGDEGNGYYSTAYNIYSLVLLISSYSIPTAISKLISEKIVLNQYNHARKIFKYAILYVTVVSGIAALLAFVLAPWIVPKGAVFALRILCPTIFLSGLVGVLRGYFQAYSTTVYTSISQILEQIFNAVVSVLAAYLFVRPYLNQPHLKASMGAGGSALGTGAGVAIALAFLFFMFLTRGKHMSDESNADPYVEDGKQILHAILTIVTPIIIATCVYNLVATIDMYIYQIGMGLKGMNHTDIIKSYGVYAGKYVVLMNVPVALASAMSTASIPAISGSYALKNMKDVRTSIDSAISVTMLVIIPCAVGLAVLSYPIMGVLFPQKETIKMASLCLTIGAPATIFYGLSTLSNGILQAIGAVNVPLKNAVNALIVHAIVLILLIVVVPNAYAVYTLPIGTMVYAFQMCITNQRAMKKLTHYKYHPKRLFMIPIVASIIMGVGVYCIYQLLFMLTRRVFLPLMLSILLGIVLYFVVIIFFYQGREEQLDQIPYLNRILRKLKH